MSSTLLSMYLPPSMTPELPTPAWHPPGTEIQSISLLSTGKKVYLPQRPGTRHFGVFLICGDGLVYV